MTGVGLKVIDAMPMSAGIVPSETSEASGKWCASFAVRRIGSPGAPSTPSMNEPSVAAFARDGGTLSTL